MVPSFPGWFWGLSLARGHVLAVLPVALCSVRGVVVDPCKGVGQNSTIDLAPDGICCWKLPEALSPDGSCFLSLRPRRFLPQGPSGGSCPQWSLLFLLYLLEPGLRVGRLREVHLIDGPDELLDAKGVGEQGLLPRLPVLGDAGLELSTPGGGNEGPAVGLTVTSDHVLDEVMVAGGIDGGAVMLGRLELPQGDVDCDAALPLRLELIHDPCASSSNFSKFLFLLPPHW